MTQAFSPSILWSKLDAPLDGDCACPDDALAFVPGAPPHSVVRWETAPDLYRAGLPGDHELVSSPVGPASVVVLNESARLLLDAFVTGCSVQQAADRLALTPDVLNGPVEQLAALHLLQPVGQPAQPVYSEPRTLTAWLHLTNACNLDCAYCYLNKDGEAMPEATGLAAVEAVFRAAQAHGFERVKLKYAGGEPALNFALVRTLHAHARDLAQRSGLALSEILLSNGIALTRPALNYLRDAQIRLMISLDSVGDDGDLRVFRNGRASSPLTVRAVERALDCGVAPHLSITVSEQTASRLAAVVAFALDRDLTFNLNFVRGVHGALSAEGQARLLAGLRAALAVIEARLPRQSLIGALVDRARFDQPHSQPCGAGRSYMVIDHQGGVSRCQMQMHAPAGYIAQDDPLLAVPLADSPWTNPPVEAKAECASCTWRYWCAGGCPLLAYQVTGRSEARSPYCAIYKAIYPEVLRLESLRLLKWERML